MAPLLALLLAPQLACAPPTGPRIPSTPSLLGHAGGTGALVFDGDVPTNLLFISLDTTRRDYLGRFSGGDHTPHLDALLAQGVVLEAHRSCSNWTAPSMTCVISGKTPLAHGFWPRSFDPAIPDRPPRSYDTLPMYLGELGFQSVLITANDIFSMALGIPEGFDRIIDMDQQPADQVTTAALEELATLGAQPGPWYLHLHYIDPHAAYCPPPEHVDPAAYLPFPYDVCTNVYGLVRAYGSWEPTLQRAFLDNVRELYRAEIAAWDVQLGRLLDEAGALGLLEHTLVVFVTDHGEQLMERGLIGHGLTLSQEENRSTAAFWAKSLRPGVVGDPTVHQDLTETLYTLWGITPATPTEGQLVGTADSDRIVTALNYWLDAPIQLMAADRDRQLLYDTWGDRRLYRTDVDPAGLDDVYDPNDPDVIALWEVLAPLVEQAAAAWDHLPEPVAPGP